MEGDKVILEGPREILTSGMLEDLKTKKAEIVNILREPLVEPEHETVWPTNVIALRQAARPAHRNSSSKPEFAPLGHLLGRSPNGGWFQVAPGTMQHFREPPTEQELAEERAWLVAFRQKQAEDRERQLEADRQRETKSTDAPF
jgi:hypothetical protein